MSGSLVVLEPGFFTTVQDLGRPGFASLGISASGAADPIALRAGNRLVGNAATAAALEMTLLGGSFRFEKEALVALTGGASPWTARRVPAGEVLACGRVSGGARAFLCVRGGLEVPLVLGSASTHRVTGLGGLEGRALRAGDRLAIGARAPEAPLPGVFDPFSVPGYLGDEPIRLVDGPQAAWFDDGARARLVHAMWTISEACDRMGIHLEGPGIGAATDEELLTEGSALGAIQVTTGGRPIVLFVEHQTTGGYPKIANVVAADLPRLGRLRPRDRIRFVRVSIAEAHEALRVQEDALRAQLR